MERLRCKMQLYYELANMWYHDHLPVWNMVDIPVKKVSHRGLVVALCLSGLSFCISTLVYIGSDLKLSVQVPELTRQAICMTGNKAEALLLDGVFEHHKRNLFTHDTDLFMYIQTDLKVSETATVADGPFFNVTRLKEMYSPWLKKLILITNATEENTEIGFHTQHLKIDDRLAEGWHVGKHMFYKMMKCQTKMVEPSEEERGKPYDIVFRVRPDIYILERPNIDMVYDHPDHLFTEGGNCTLNPDGRFLDPTPGPAIMDMAFFGTSRIMRLVNNMYYLVIGGLHSYPYDRSFPEAFLGFWLDKLSIPTKCAGLPYDLPRGVNFDQVPRNQKEIKENSPAVLSVQGNREILVKNGSELGKTYTFDKVFGPNATQQVVFDQVVVGMLSETGTGKTFTMEGDLSSRESKDAGIIPRTLAALFETLEKDHAEYSVRVSYTELYNEELKDLLSPEDDVRKLKLYEDLNRRGSVVIQGLEECLVKSVDDVLQLMQRGSLKRQIASTKMNEASSRSHGIFSITVHIKECTPEGEELLKVGKLNLVDLAGSENIGRSGAENKRAKEAGMINQSLLTLGRVINALVERSPHIPYRESKLTRILQDSLGGRTKTCIIAALSPARVNIEESLSTLDYAHRAKNIRNKPEVNQKLTKRAVIREYVTAIDRLKADLLAAREKNGIFLSPESYNTLVDENQGRKDRIDEITKTLDAKEEEIKALEEKFTSQMQLLTQTTTQLDEAMTELDQKQQELRQMMAETENLRARLDEQEFLTMSHIKTEEQLDELATGLVSTIKSSVKDLSGLHEKLDRKISIEIENQNLFQEFQNHIFYEHQKTLEANALEFKDQINDNQQASRRMFEEQQTSVEHLNQELSQISQKKTEQVNQIKNVLQEFESRSQMAFQEMTVLNQKVLKDTKSALDMFRHGIMEQLTNMMQKERQQHETTVAHLQEHIRELQQAKMAQVERAARDMSEIEQEKQKVLDQVQHLLSGFASDVAQRSQASQEATMNDLNKQEASILQVLDAGAVHSNVMETERQRLSDEAQEMTLHDRIDSIKSESVKMNAQAGSYCYNLETAIEQEKSLASEWNQKHSSLSKNGIDTIHSQLEAMREKQTAAMTEGAQAFASLAASTTDERQASKKQHHQSEVHLKQAEHLIASGLEFVEAQTLQKDAPTGKTPRKREIVYPESWERTKDHESLLQENTQKE
ncbi:hypothetical protein EDD86DRAFT_249575 [Gorgonomyces haynaldii]|nr:hypothetical protein EDD86DRAFT_249575 [Gorgonomyces haynaldii]